MTTESRLKAIEEQLEELIKLTRSNQHNTHAIYRRTTALAYMLERIASHSEVQIPKIIRAEIDASLHPDLFVELAKKDEAEFIRRYGDITLKVLREKGIESISRIGDFAPSGNDKPVMN